MFDQVIDIFVTGLEKKVLLHFIFSIQFVNTFHDWLWFFCLSQYAIREETKNIKLKGHKLINCYFKGTIEEGVTKYLNWKY